MNSGGDSLPRLDVRESVHEKHAGITVHSGIKLSHQPVAVQNRQSEVSPATTSGRFLHLERVFELEQSAMRLRSSSTRSKDDDRAARPVKS